MVEIKEEEKHAEIPEKAEIHKASAENRKDSEKDNKTAEDKNSENDLSVLFIYIFGTVKKKTLINENTCEGKLLRYMFNNNDWMK